MVAARRRLGTPRCRLAARGARTGDTDGTGEALTVEILEQIRDGIGSLKVDFNERLDQANQRLERVEQGLLDLGQFMRQIALDQTRHERFHTQHVDILEKDVSDLKERVRRLEERPGR